MHANECLNKKQQPFIYSEDSGPREEDKDYDIEEDNNAHGDVNTIGYKKQIPVVLKHCNVAKEETLFMFVGTMNSRIFKGFLVKNGITKI